MNEKPPPSHDEALHAQREERRRRTLVIQALTRLANRVAHDMNNVLSGTLGFASHLQTKVEPGGDMHKQLSLIEAAALRGNEITQHLLLFSRRRDERGESVNPAGLIRELVAEMNQAGELEIAVEEAGPIPALAGRKEKLRNLFRNLLINALEAAPEGDMPRITVRFEHRQLTDAERFVHDRPDDQRDYVCARLEDSGRGFQRDLRERLFEPYATTKTHGLVDGFGLAVAYAHVEDHDGIIDLPPCESGACVLIMLPCRELSVHAPKSAPARRLPSDSLKGDETLLVIDDESIIRNMLGDVLPRFGYRVLCAGGGQEGLDVVREQGDQVKLILLDLNMPGGLSGEETYERLRELAPHIPVVIFSGYIVPSIQEKLERKGVRGFIPKPFKNLDLLGQIRQMIDRPSRV